MIKIIYHVFCCCIFFTAEASGIEYSNNVTRSYAYYNPAPFLGVIESDVIILVDSFTIDLSIKSSSSAGIIFFTEYEPHPFFSDVRTFFAAGLQNGYVEFSFADSAVIGTAISISPINNNEWTRLVFVKKEHNGWLCVEEESCVHAETSGISPPQIKNAFYIGGIPQNLIEKANETLGHYEGLIGCIVLNKIDGIEVREPDTEYNTSTCYQQIEEDDIINGTCQQPTAIANGQFYPQLSTYAYNTKVQYVCDTGYQIVGSSSITNCNESLLWDVENISCSATTPLSTSEPDVITSSSTNQPEEQSFSGCTNPPEFPNTNWTEIEIGTLVNYSCIEGFQLADGSLQKICINNISWSGNDPICMSTFFLQPITLQYTDEEPITQLERFYELAGVTDSDKETLNITLGTSAGIIFISTTLALLISLDFLSLGRACQQIKMKCKKKPTAKKPLEKGSKLYKNNRKISQEINLVGLVDIDSYS